MSIIETLYIAYFSPGMFRPSCHHHLQKSLRRRLGHFHYSYDLLQSICIVSLLKIYLDLQKEEERPKEKEKGKPRVIDKFMEELKFEQEQREKRSQDRDHRRDRHSDSSMVGAYICKNGPFVSFHTSTRGPYGVIHILFGLLNIICQVTRV